MSKDRYLELLASRLMDFAEGKTKRLLINLPPRHLKTQLCTVSFAAWILAHKPDTKIMLITYGQDLAIDIARSIRALHADWYSSVFKTRIARGRGKVRNFYTTAGGRVYATSFDGSITGFGADIILVDDPHNATDLSADRIEKTILQFNSVVAGRLNNPDEGRIMVVGHRVHENDLSANLVETGEWTHVALPVMAVKTKTYDTCYGPWRRKKERYCVLRDTIDVAFKSGAARRSVRLLIFTIRGLEAKALPEIKPTDFPSYQPTEVEALRRFISVHPGTSDREGCSYSVAQVWASNGVDFFLVDQFRRRCRFDELAMNVRTFAKIYCGASILGLDGKTILIFRTPTPPHFAIGAIERRLQRPVVERTAFRNSNFATNDFFVERAEPNAQPLNRRKQNTFPPVFLFNSASAQKNRRAPCVCATNSFDFQMALTTDQVDAMTQFLDLFRRN